MTKQQKIIFYQAIKKALAKLPHTEEEVKEIIDNRLKAIIGGIDKTNLDIIDIKEPENPNYTYTPPANANNAPYIPSSSNYSWGSGGSSNSSSYSSSSGYISSTNYTIDNVVEDDFDISSLFIKEIKQIGYTTAKNQLLIVTHTNKIKLVDANTKEIKVEISIEEKIKEAFITDIGRTILIRTDTNSLFFYQLEDNEYVLKNEISNISLSQQKIVVNKNMSELLLPIGDKYALYSLSFKTYNLNLIEQDILPNVKCAGLTTNSQIYYIENNVLKLKFKYNNDVYILDNLHEPIFDKNIYDMFVSKDGQFIIIGSPEENKIFVYTKGAVGKVYLLETFEYSSSQSLGKSVTANYNSNKIFGLANNNKIYKFMFNLIEMAITQQEVEEAVINHKDYTEQIVTQPEVDEAVIQHKEYNNEYVTQQEVEEAL